MLIAKLFKKDVTRNIPPVVYFHEQDGEKLRDEVSEYIITGGYPSGDPRASEGGIHEQFVRLLTAMRRELDRSGGPDLPACWISGFYGSGKSSFAKLLGLALDGRPLPDGTPLSDALLGQDHSPKKDEFARAWRSLVADLKPVGVVFDIGSKARDDEHVHSVVVRQVLQRFGYSSASSAVAEYELQLELEGMYDDFLKAARELFKKPWTDLKDTPLAEDRFSAVMHRLDPKQFPTPMSWVDVRTGSLFSNKRSVDEAVQAIRSIVEQRCPGRTLFIVVDEVSQYVHDNQDRMLALQSLVSALGQRMKGKAWLLATGQQKLEESAGNLTTLSKLKDRFPSALRVHLGTANIRDVLHRRLLRKDSSAESKLRELYQKHQSDLSLYAYRGDEISVEDFVDVYPLLPGHIDLLLKITSGLRVRTTRAQGDSHAIRGLLQLLGDLFREQRFDQREVGQLITIDRVYDVLHTALDTDVQSTLTRAFEFCGRHNDALMARVVKAVALLELLQDDNEKTSTELIARCLYERLGQPNPQEQIQTALNALVAESLLGLSEKSGYKIQSSAGQDWQRERDAYAVGTEQINDRVREALRWLVDDVDKPKVGGLELPWRALFSDGLGQKDARIKDERKHTVVTVDFQFTQGEASDQWVPRSDSPVYVDRIVWVVGDRDGPRDEARQMIRSERMIERYGSRQSSLPDEKQRLLMEERNLLVAAKKKLEAAVKAAFMVGDVYFRGRQLSPGDAGTAFEMALAGIGNRVLPELYPHIPTFSITDKEILYLIDNTELAAPPAVFGEDKLGLLKLDAGRYEVTAEGRVPCDVLNFVTSNVGVTGSSLLAHFGSPPHGIPPDVVKATVVGLLRGRKLRVRMPEGAELTSVRDEGARELLKETGLRRAELLPNATPPDPRTRVEICKLFKEHFGAEIARNDEAIADAVAQRFGGVRERLTELSEQFRQLPPTTVYPEVLSGLEKALENCRRSRQVEPTVTALKRSLPALRDGLSLLRRMETDLDQAAVETLKQAGQVWEYHWPQLEVLAPPEPLRRAAQAIREHLVRERPWEDTGELAPQVEALLSAYQEHRRGTLDREAAKLDEAIDQLKRQEGYDRLSPDECQHVLSPIRDGAALDTDERAVAPALAVLDELFQARLEATRAKALARLDDVLERVGGPPTVDLTLGIHGTLVRSVTELDRLLGEIRQRVLRELDAKHRVRLR